MVCFICQGTEYASCTLASSVGPDAAITASVAGLPERADAKANGEPSAEATSGAASLASEHPARGQRGATNSEGRAPAPMSSPVDTTAAATAAPPLDLERWGPRESGCGLATAAEARATGATAPDTPNPRPVAPTAAAQWPVDSRV